MTFKIFLTQPIPFGGTAILQEHFTNVDVWTGALPCPHSVIVEKCSDADALVTFLGDNIDQSVLSGPNLKIVSQFGVGTDNVDLTYAASRKLPVSHTPGVLTEACADHAWALLTAAARRIVPSNRYVISGEWLSKGASPRFIGNDVFGQTLGVIGAGRIGQAVLKRGTGFSMKLLYNGPHEKPELAKIGAEYRNLEELLKESDYVVLTCALTNSTKGLIGAPQLGLMKKSGILVNLARGAVVVTDDLLVALREGVIGGAALDVTDPEPLPPDHPLLGFDNCLVVSHIGSATVPTRTTMARVVAQAIIDGLEGKRIQFCANPAAYD